MISTSMHGRILGSFSDKKTRRIILSEQDACSIFQRKPLKGVRDRGTVYLLASIYGVSIKTIRDIWVGRTWYRSTCYLDQSKPINLRRLERKPGRPLGAKDSKPRLSTPRGPGPPTSTAFAQGGVTSHCPEALALLNLWRLALSQPAAALDVKRSAICDDPFHDDWPFW